MDRELIGHQSNEIWMGELILTLADLIPDAPRAVLVGINPAPPSVAAGHYYQGRAGRRIMTRLRFAGLLPSEPVGFDDDDAHRHGIGFTDIIKRPTAGASDLRPDEFRHGARYLRTGSKRHRPDS